MPAQPVLNARPRSTDNGDASPRELRQNARVPGVVYGRGLENRELSVSREELVKLLRKGGLQNTLVDLQVEDEDEARNVLIKDVQLHPVEDRVMHVDFHQVHADDRVQVDVPIELVGESPGVERDNGIVDQPVRELQVECRVDELPSTIRVDIGELEIGDALMVEDIDPPRDVEFLTAQDRTILSIQPPREFDLETTPATEAEVIEETVEEALEEVAEGEEVPEEALEEVAEGEEVPEEAEVPEGEEAPADDVEPAPEEP